MTAGMQVFNDANTIVIDSESVNFVFHSKGSITTSAPPADVQVFPKGTTYEKTIYKAYYCASIGAVYLTGAPQGGVFAIQCTSNAAPSTYPYPAVNSLGAYLELACEGPPGTVINWWYFAPLNNVGPSSEGAGLRVFSSTGVLTYDSGRLPIKYVDFKSGPGSPGNTAAGGPYTYPSGRQYALIVNCGGGYVGKKRRSTMYCDYVCMGVGGRVNSNVVYTADVLGATPGSYSLYGISDNPLYFSWGVMVVDVTDL